LLRSGSFFFGGFVMAARRKSAGSRKHSKEFLSTLASAILGWQYVEAELFFMFAALVRGNFPAMSAAFHAVVNFNTRLEMVDQAAAVTLASSPLLRHWHAISARLNKRAKHRNKLVHFTLMGRPSKDPKSPVSLFISQSIFDNRVQPRLEYDLKQIQKFEELFDESRQEIADFHAEVRVALSPSR
jgi:hypothetical protein